MEHCSYYPGCCYGDNNFFFFFFFFFFLLPCLHPMSALAYDVIPHATTMRDLAQAYISAHILFSHSFMLTLSVYTQFHIYI